MEKGRREGRKRRQELNKSYCAKYPEEVEPSGTDDRSGGMLKGCCRAAPTSEMLMATCSGHGVFMDP